VLVDARTVPDGKIIETDVCIVGAGAAGITVARELVGQPFRVCVLESGGFEADPDTQGLARGDSVGVPYFPLIAARLRYFGGTTNHWDGWCRPLDPLDFEVRDWVPHSGWPFDHRHLAPFYARAQPICQLGAATYELEDWKSDALPLLPFAGDRVTSVIFQHSAPTRFGARYRGALVAANNVSLYLNANAVELETDRNGGTVRLLRAACLTGNRFAIAARRYVVATGGIENARLLLASTKVEPGGVGNRHDLVGRFFMEHPHLESGYLLPSSPEVPVRGYSYLPLRINTARVSALVTLTPETLRREKLVGFSAVLLPRSRSEISTGVASFRVIRRALRQWTLPEDFVKHLGNVISDIDDVAAVAYEKAWSRSGVPGALASLYNRMEQAPNPDSRVTLSEERDPFGKPLARLDWRLSELDKRSIRRAHEIFGEEVGRAGIGRFHIDVDATPNWPPLLIGGFHHMGTTRMHTDPRRGVVDANAQVHGVSNLFLAGSSVFPTSGYTGPTLTIVALALRLADHLKRLMR
jgi:choline dehydrogenase-like flavoprotein